MKQIAHTTGINESYLKLLKREVNNLLPSPVEFSKVPLISEKILEKLQEMDVRDTEGLFPLVRDHENRERFIKRSGLSGDEIMWLTRLVDVSRIKWVGPKLARLIVDTPYNTVDKLANADPQAVLEAFNEAKKQHKAYEGSLGINDIESWISQVVKKTPLIIAY